MLRSSRWPVSVLALAAAVAVPMASAAAQHSDMQVSPFIGFLPSAGTSPLAGLALTLGGSGAFALRGSANLALESSNNSTTGAVNRIRPWGVDADAMFLFGGHAGSISRSIQPFAFVGLGSMKDEFGVTSHDWSYGAGAAFPIGTSVDLFGEGRWRMSRYVLPTASGAPSPDNELRFGVSFHVGSNPSEQRRPRGRRISVKIE